MMISSTVDRLLGGEPRRRSVGEVAFCDPAWEKPALRLATVPQDGPVYAFQSIRVDPARRLILRGQERVRVTAKVFDLLLALIRSRHRVATRDELIRQLWPDTFVEDGNLSVHISTLRKALNDRCSDQSMIETLPRVGYRFVAAIREE
jgi:DNA-binding winged helix-turn-helix (wHTH) protein